MRMDATEFITFFANAVDNQALHTVTILTHIQTYPFNGPFPGLPN